MRVSRARKLLLSPARTNGKRPTRLHMNSYLQELVSRFGRYSVEELILKVERRLKQAVGTVYVGDLLAIADAVLPLPIRHRRREARSRRRFDAAAA